MLQPDGLLPVGRHSVTADEFKTHFVDAFGENLKRRRLYLRWQRHREALVSVVPVFTQWVNGSYVTDEPEPGDVDVASLFDAVAFDGLAPGLQQMVATLVDGKNTRAVWGIDSYPVPVYPEGHPFRGETNKIMAYWDRQWQLVKRDARLKKGYLEVAI